MDKPKKTSNFSMRMDPELKERLEKLAKAERRSIANYIEGKLWEILEKEEGVVHLSRRRK